MLSAAGPVPHAEPIPSVWLLIHPNRILLKAKILLVLFSHELLSTNILYINLHIVSIIQFKTS